MSHCNQHAHKLAAIQITIYDNCNYLNTTKLDSIKSAVRTIFILDKSLVKLQVSLPNSGEQISSAS